VLACLPDHPAKLIHELLPLNLAARAPPLKLRESNMREPTARALHEELSSDYNDMIYAATREEVGARRKTFIRKWRLKHRAAPSPEAYLTKDKQEAAS
jgi:hypothetical protein